MKKTKRIKVREHLRTKPSRNASGRFKSGKKQKGGVSKRVKVPKRGQLALL